MAAPVELQAPLLGGPNESHRRGSLGGRSATREPGKSEVPRPLEQPSVTQGAWRDLSGWQKAGRAGLIALGIILIAVIIVAALFIIVKAGANAHSGSSSANDTAAAAATFAPTGSSSRPQKKAS